MPATVSPLPVPPPLRPMPAASRTSCTKPSFPFLSDRCGSATVFKAAARTEAIRDKISFFPFSAILLPNELHNERCVDGRACMEIHRAVLFACHFMLVLACRADRMGEPDLALLYSAQCWRG